MASTSTLPPSSAKPSSVRNPIDKPWVIQKYGGTSLGKFIDNITMQIIPSYIESGNRVAVVCSARSGESKSTGTTNLLLRAALEALRPRAPDMSSSIPSLPPTPAPGTPGVASSDRINPLTSQIFQRSSSTAVSPSTSNHNNNDANHAGTFTKSGVSTPQSTRSNSLAASISSLRVRDLDEGPQLFHGTIDQIKDDHLKAARAFIKDPQILAELEDDLDYDCERLRSFLLAAQIIDEISSRSKDIIMGVGERLSCRIVVAVLNDRGVEAELVSLENIVEGSPQDDEEAKGESKQLSQPFYDRLSKRLGERLNECGDRVPVVTGFFGVVPGSLLAQVGRGYSDLCAALCAVGVGASELQVWKEVDGIFTADPRKVPTARLLSTITPEEAAELTYYGSEVIHPFTMEQVIRASIPIRIKNVENPSGSGTIIFPDLTTTSSDEGGSDAETDPSSTFTTPTSTSPLVIPPRRGPTAITIKDDILVLSIRSNRKTISHGFFARIFGTLDKYGVIVDLISTSEVHVSMAINGSIRAPILERMTKELKVVGEVIINRDMCILSLVGKHMKNMVGIAGKMFTTLAEGNINIEMISQGASEINISSVIDGRDAVKALNLVHHKLLSQGATAVRVMGPWMV
ncbi:BQ2448_1413 [Microbotryum intermedium]|uniref:aspartate kinase n=1 Tax=Microbotryum intermedium TaxID=269621 RepID=A0A238FB62_9BASI|nr:BQ2448_1413 [Microbotryum intermedium]